MFAHVFSHELWTTHVSKLTSVLKKQLGVGVLTNPDFRTDPHILTTHHFRETMRCRSAEASRQCAYADAFAQEIRACAEEEFLQDVYKEQKTQRIWNRREGPLSILPGSAMRERSRSRAE